MAKIRYRKVPKSERTNKRQKYELLEDVLIETRIRVGNRRIIIPDYAILSPNGDLVIRKPYRWDGASFFLARNTAESMRATLAHDCIYQLMREGLLDISFRKAADKEMLRIGIIDGMWGMEIELWYQAVRVFGKKAASKIKK